MYYGYRPYNTCCIGSNLIQVYFCSTLPMSKIVQHYFQIIEGHCIQKCFTFLLMFVLAVKIRIKTFCSNGLHAPKFKDRSLCFPPVCAALIFFNISFLFFTLSSSLSLALPLSLFAHSLSLSITLYHGLMERCSLMDMLNLVSEVHNLLSIVSDRDAPCC